ncbi:Alpha/Beta hydrolase protein [Triangularia verruculosa]|uniref:Alpha/Beta hydrolase protein n=1 Tax=Triangularia verruculosa TaxID=2587418 RepID=A0AAN6XMY2_9PEZI|nr:Alpha/Beta hydrolase protein [Triangularia verruculosa]
MAPKIPQPSDFSKFPSIQLHPPSPPESTTTFLIVLHGLGDNPVSFSAFPKSLNLPGVYAITVRGVSPLPPSLLPEPAPEYGCFHWGDDLTLDSGTGELDSDPGFEKARGVLLEELIQGVIVGELGWGVGDVIVFGYGQGGGVALGLGSEVRRLEGGRVGEVVEGEEGEGEKRGKGELKGVVSVGGGLPGSMIPSLSKREKVGSPVLVMCGEGSEVVDEDAEERLREEFERVKIVRWGGRRRGDDGMPRTREEVLPLMEFFAERLREF